MVPHDDDLDILPDDDVDEAHPEAIVLTPEDDEDGSLIQAAAIPEIAPEIMAEIDDATLEGVLDESSDIPRARTEELPLDAAGADGKKSDELDWEDLIDPGSI